MSRTQSLRNISMSNLIQIEMFRSSWDRDIEMTYLIQIEWVISLPRTHLLRITVMYA